MRQVLILFFFILFIFSCSKEKNAKDIIIDDVITPCDCVSSFYLVISEINSLNKNQSIIDSADYMSEKKILESIMRSINEKCIVYEGEDSDLQSCVDYQKLVIEMEKYGLK